MNNYIYYVTVVVYNKECECSVTCNQLIDIQKQCPIKVFIADNSTIQTNNEKFCNKYSWNYISMKGNKGLSCAYNSVINYINSFNRNECIVWLDDDTAITIDYFRELNKQFINQNLVDIFVPIVYGSNNIIYSPNERGFLKNHLLQRKDQCPRMELFNAINSCMAVRLSFYKNYRYDEKLFMDVVDQKFCKEACEKKTKFAILNTTIKQDFFQRSENLTSNRAWIRYKIRIKDFMNYANGNWIYRWLGLIKITAWGIDIAIKCKSPIIFMKCIACGFKYAIMLSIGKKI